MIEFSYRIHRALKLAKPSSVELRLIDQDLAEFGVCIPGGSGTGPDLTVRTAILAAMQDILNAA
jgi:hypothetical protein